MTEPAKKVFETTKKKSVFDEINDRQTEEIIIALCGAAGSGTSTIAKKIEKLLSDDEYTVNFIKISTLIEKQVEKIKPKLINDPLLKGINFDQPLDKMDKADRMAILQSAGNILRKTTEKDILAQLAIKDIAAERAGTEEKEEGTGKRKSRRVVTIIDSLKNPDEVKLLQLVYKEMFYLFGVLCPETIRQKRLIKKGFKPERAVQLMERDKSEGIKHGQQFLKTILYSDFFVRNSKDNAASTDPSLERFIKILLGNKSITPKIEESAMYYAQSTAVKSACLSRQVGAAIIDKEGALISTGCNDVPKAGGGLYSTEDQEDDNRCITSDEETCENEKLKENIFKELDEILSEQKIENKKKDIISKKIRSHDRLNSLIEYCRAIHAEMDAIISAARKGATALKGASLFCTTFPCHNCARHIIAAGIESVYYIEPYEKSLALQLHGDAIIFEPETKKGSFSKVRFEPFEGVAPRKYLNLFQAGDKKN